MIYLFEKLIKHWDVVKAAPFPVFIFVLIAGAMGWLISNWYYDAKVASLDSRLSSKDGEIALITRQRDEYKEKLGGASPDAAKARIEDLESKIRFLMPRRISEEQRVRLVEILKRTAGKVEIGADMSVADASGFASGLINAFNNAHWKTETPAVLGVSNPPPLGLGLIVPNPNSLTMSQKLVVEALRAAKVEFDLQEGIIDRSNLPRHLSFPGLDARIIITNRQK